MIFCSVALLLAFAASASAGPFEPIAPVEPKNNPIGLSFNNIITNAESLLKENGVDAETLENAKEYLTESFGVDREQIVDTANTVNDSFEKVKKLFNITEEESLEEIKAKITASTENLGNKVTETISAVTGLSKEETERKLTDIAEVTGFSSYIGDFFGFPSWLSPTGRGLKVQVPYLSPLLDQLVAVTKAVAQVFMNIIKAVATVFLNIITLNFWPISLESEAEF